MQNNINLKIGLLSFLFILLGLVLNFFRTSLLGIAEGYAPHNLTFSVYVFLPILLISFLLGSFAFVKELQKLSKVNYKGVGWRGYVTLIVSFPGFLFGLIGLIVTCIFLMA